DSSGESPYSSVFTSWRRFVIAVNHHHSFIIRHNYAIKTQSIAQQVSQDTFRGSHYFAIQLRVGIHHRHYPSISDCSLEWSHIDIPQVSFTQVHWTTIKPAL